MKIRMATLVGTIMMGFAGLMLAADAPATTAPMEKAAAVSPSVYVCPDCHTMAMQAGKCTGCQKDMVQRHLLGTKDGQAMLCSCGSGCACDAKGMKDGKCACGKEVKMMSCKGMYCCPKGCPQISDKPGKCACGEEMKKVE